MSELLPPQQNDAPQIHRVRHDLRRRRLEVASVERLTPHMIRVALTGPELAGFTSASPDDHIKIFIPGLDGVLTRRDYTPRRYDAKTGMLVLDFVNHHGGPAAAWARAAIVGDTLEIGGPRGSQIVSESVTSWLLIGDETALPAIGRRVEELSERSSVITVVAVSGQEDEQSFETSAQHDAYWVYRPLEEADQAQGLLAKLADLEIPERTFVWVGAEAHVAKAVRHYLLEERGINARWLKASGYWLKGQADVSVKNVGEEAL